MKTDFLPPHLKKYVVEQNYEKYTPVDQAVWRYILRQLKAFLSKHAHECYVDGLEKTGINVEEIPQIEYISQHLEKFGWRALPVSGFIPPAAFMELQSLGVLPIASDMRSLDHLLYTPAPDIVHEAAGHAPILIHPEFSNYLKRYAQVAKKAIISKEDLDIYEAIRDLSDLKENPQSTAEEIKAAESHLDNVSKNVSHVSEASELSRMNWWTAEYGLIGSLENPKIFGAGLLSSVGESRWCLSPKVKKIPLSVDCIKMTYDITEPQPQLYVAKDFNDLVKVLDEMAEQMAFRIGGLAGIQKAIQAQSVNTVELNSGIQCSGQIVEAITNTTNEVIYIRLQGPSQLSYKDQELLGHDKGYHAHGFGTPVGKLKLRPTECPSNFSEQDWKNIGVIAGQKATLEFTSGVVVTGVVKGLLIKDGKNLLLSLENASALYQERVLFAPEWGTFDMALGSTVTSVFGGPADREAYGELTDFVAKRVPKPQYSETELTRHSQYGELRKIRTQKLHGDELTAALDKLIKTHQDKFPTDWLFFLEALELVYNRSSEHPMKQTLEQHLDRLSKESEKAQGLIEDGLSLVRSL